MSEFERQYMGEWKMSEERIFKGHKIIKPGVYTGSDASLSVGGQKIKPLSFGEDVEINLGKCEHCGKSISVDEPDDTEEAVREFLGRLEIKTCKACEASFKSDFDELAAK